MDLKTHSYSTSTPQSHKSRYLDLWLLIGLLTGIAILYLLTLDNGLRFDELTGGDLITHQYAQIEARPSNAPGYPLYTMGGWLWFRLGTFLLGWGLNPTQILSLYSTLWGLASLGVLYLILRRVSSELWWLAPLLTIFYATTFFFWYYSITTEQYTSAVFQTLLIILLAFKWDEQPQDSTLLWLAFISGTMLANMVTTLFILPPLLWFIFFRKNNSSSEIMLVHYLKRPGYVIKAIGVTLLPFLSYAYIYIRGAQHPEWRGEGNWDSAWDWFIQFMTIQQGRDELGPGLSFENFITDEFPALMWQELTWPIFLGGLVGIAVLGRRRAIFLYGTLLIYLIFTWGYRFGNWFQVIIPAYPILIIGVGVGIRLLIKRGRKIERFPFWATPTFIALVLVGLITYRFTASLPEANQRNRPDATGLNPGWAILADQPQTPALIAVNFEEEVALEYLGTAWNVAQEIEGVTLEVFNQDEGQAHRYVSRNALNTDVDLFQQSDIFPQAVGAQLIVLSSEASTSLPPEVSTTDLSFGDQFRLIGWEIIGSNEAGWQIALYWQTDQPLTVDYTISVRPLVEGQLINLDGENLIQDHQPVWGVYPTSRWRPNEVIRDVYVLPVLQNIQPNAVQIVVYHTTNTGFENLGDHVITLP